MSNKICLITDLHMGVHNNSEIYFESQKRFLVNEFIPYLETNKINTIFFLGDMFDNRDTINTKVQNNVFNLFNDHLKQFDIYVI